MTAEEALKAGQLDDALKALQDSVRQNPADPRLRRFLFQLHCVLGRWDKALTQLQVLADMDSDSFLLASIFQPLIQCEMLRAEVFQGKRSPIVFGEPERWVGLLVQANALVSSGDIKVARALQKQALEEAPATPGSLNGQPFEWIADADSRLGPVIEAMIDGRYCWVPMNRIRTMTVSAPKDLRDLVWTPAQFVWTNGGDTSGFIPTRYPRTELSSDGALRLARKTEWEDAGEEVFIGLGQRVFATDTSDVPLLEVRSIEFTHADSPTETAASATSDQS
ncbi:MAG: type VI secretion system accessory protein TagJ [Chthoniobacteraceae bacterium]